MRAGHAAGGRALQRRLRFDGSAAHQVARADRRLHRAGRARCPGRFTLVTPHDHAQRGSQVCLAMVDAAEVQGNAVIFQLMKQKPLAAPTSPAELFYQAVQKQIPLIVFDPQGFILEANDLFLSVVGYRAEEVIGQHHKMFCDMHYVKSNDYIKFWQDLAKGIPQSKTFIRYKNGGSAIALEATYFPVIDNGRVIRIIKFASDVTEKTAQLKDQEAIILALNKSQAVIEFESNGTIITANDNFLHYFLAYIIF